ncbi:MAG: hypothetical protein ACK5H1_04645 [Tenacibaculum sp.]
MEEKLSEKTASIQKVKEELDFLENLTINFNNAFPKEKKHLILKLASNPVLINEKLQAEAKKPYLTLQYIRKHKSLHIEPPKNHSTKGIKGDLKTCYAMWLVTLP